MQSQITLGDLRAYYYQIVNPADANDPDFLVYVNKALQRIIEGAEFLGVNVETVFNGSTGQITLPPHMRSIIGVTLNNVPRPVYSEFHQYCEFGPGTFDPSLPAGRFLQQVAEGVPSVVDLTAGHQVRFANVVPGDAGKVARVFGDDTNNNPIFDVTTGNEGIQIVWANPVTMSTPLNRFTGLQKTPTLGRINAYDWDGTTATLISQYQPNETRPSYARYLTGTLDSQQNIGCLCRRRFMPVFVDTDFIPIGNLAAWENAIQAVKFDSIEQFDKSDSRWKECFMMLNREHMASRGMARPEVAVIGPLANSTRVRCN